MAIPMPAVHLSILARLAMFLHRSILVRLMIFCLAGILVASVGLYGFEHGHTTSPDSPYRHWHTTALNILVLFTSGFDVDPPRTAGGWISAFVALGLGICFLGLFTGEVASWLVERRLKGGAAMKAVTCSGHVIVTRWGRDTEEVVALLVSEDLASHRRPIVVVDRERTDLPVEHPMVYLVRGDPTDSETLKRAGIERAATALILADPAASDPNTEDARNMMVVLAIETLNREVYTCVQVLNPDNTKHFRRAGADEVICTAQLSTKIVVQSAIHHGLSRVLDGLLSYGAGSEIYRVPLGERWAGRTYTELVAELRRSHKATLLALESDGTIHVNPVEEVTARSGDHVFVLAQDYPEGISR
jgi:voltage-gated potassium channel